nr:hypothetical protein [Anaerolineae bacterium]
MPWRLDTDAIEWIEEETGRRVNLEGAGDLVDALIDAASDDEIDELLDILGDEPDEEKVEEWKQRFWLLLKWLYIALALVGGAGELVVGDWEAVQILLLFQLDYLDR